MSGINALMKLLFWGGNENCQVGTIPWKSFCLLMVVPLSLNLASSFLTCLPAITDINSSKDLSNDNILSFVGSQTLCVHVIHNYANISVNGNLTQYSVIKGERKLLYLHFFMKSDDESVRPRSVLRYVFPTWSQRFCSWTFNFPLWRDWNLLFEWYLKQV